MRGNLFMKTAIASFPLTLRSGLRLTAMTAFIAGFEKIITTGVMTFYEIAECDIENFR